jgi:hypothetical protein
LRGSIFHKGELSGGRSSLRRGLALPRHGHRTEARSDGQRDRESGRYAYANQPIIAQWSLARFAETLLPLVDPNPKAVAGSYESMKAHGPKSMVSPESAVLSVFITPCMKPTCIQTLDQQGLAFHDGLKQRQAGPLGIARVGGVAPRAAKYWKVPTRM